MMKKKHGYMSADELKYRMLQHFRESGALDGLQAQLRSKLINEVLKFSSLKKEPNVNDETDPKTPLLPLQISNWLVCNHLRHHKFEYTLSTFISEANLSNIDKLLSITDVLAMIGYDKGSSKYESLYKEFTAKTSDSFLTMFLKSVMKKSTKCTQLQSNNVEPNVTKEMDPFLPSEVFKDIFPEGASSFRIGSTGHEDNIAMHRNMRLEKEKHEREIQNLRRKLIQELDGLHEHEQQARFEIEQMKSRLTLDREMFDMEKEKFKMKEVQLQMREEHLEQEVHAKVKSHSEKILFDQKTKDTEGWENRLKEQQKWFEKELSKMQDSHTESDYLKTQLLHMEKSFKSLENDYANILQNNESLQKKLKDMSDYSSVKEELSWKSRKLDNCETELMHLKSEMQSEKLESLTSIQRLQQQLRQSVHKHGVELLNPNYSHSILWNEKFEQEFQETRQIYSTVLKRLDDQKGDIQELHRLIHDLYNKISQQKANVEKAAESASKTAFPRLPQDQHLQEARSIRDPGSLDFPLFSPDKSFIEEPLRFVNQAKKRIEALQKESQSLEQKYSEFLSAEPTWDSKIPSTYTGIHTCLPFDDFHLSGLDLPNTKASVSKPSSFLPNVDSIKGIYLDQTSHYFSTHPEMYEFADFTYKTKYDSDLSKTSVPFSSTLKCINKSSKLADQFKERKKPSIGDTSEQAALFLNSTHLSAHIDATNPDQVPDFVPTLVQQTNKRTTCVSEPPVRGKEVYNKASTHFDDGSHNVRKTSGEKHRSGDILNSSLNSEDYQKPADFAQLYQGQMFSSVIGGSGDSIEANKEQSNDEVNILATCSKFPAIDHDDARAQRKDDNSTTVNPTSPLSHTLQKLSFAQTSSSEGSTVGRKDNQVTHELQYALPDVQNTATSKTIIANVSSVGIISYGIQNMQNRTAVDSSSQRSDLHYQQDSERTLQCLEQEAKDGTAIYQKPKQEAPHVGEKEKKLNHEDVGEQAGSGGSEKEQTHNSESVRRQLQNSESENEQADSELSELHLSAGSALELSQNDEEEAW